MPPHWRRSNSAKLPLPGKLWHRILGQWGSYGNWLLTASKHCHGCLLHWVNEKNSFSYQGKTPGKFTSWFAASSRQCTSMHIHSCHGCYLPVRLPTAASPVIFSTPGYIWFSCVFHLSKIHIYVGRHLRVMKMSPMPQWLLRTAGWNLLRGRS